LPALAGLQHRQLTAIVDQASDQRPNSTLTPISYLATELSIMECPPRMRQGKGGQFFL
jgi:hypothetical protein